MFASNLDGSFVAHQYAIAAYASHSVDWPTVILGMRGRIEGHSSDADGEAHVRSEHRACFDNPTIGNEADAAGVSWRFYAGRLTATAA